MRQYTSQDLVVHPGNSSDPHVVVEVTPELAGWQYITFQVRQLPAGHTWSFATGQREMAIIVLSGRLGVESNRGQWQHIGQRENVFHGLPSALYLPRQTALTIFAESACEYAVALAPAEQDHEPRLVTPREVTIEIRGGDHATRQINSIIPPGFSCHRLVVVEVYTPGGNWSSYPPHKHDVHRTDQGGTILEADLEEVYFYKLDRPQGFAVQRIYTAPESPLEQAGLPIDALLLAGNNDVVIVPEGYHPVSSPPGYTTYYLNILAGSAQSLANSEDPRHAWVKETYQARDPRVPAYNVLHRS
jgi:5-deoxy-glucuronate isomerase